MLNKEHKYLLLLSAQLGGHHIDCIGLEYVDVEKLTETENKLIEYCKPCLNILTPSGKQDIYKLKIEDVIDIVKEERRKTTEMLGYKSPDDLPRRGW